MKEPTKLPCECLTGWNEERQMFFITWCPLHAAAGEMKAELERLRDLVGEADYEVIDTVIAKAERPILCT